MCRKIVDSYKLYNIDLKENVTLDALKDIKTITRDQLYDAALKYSAENGKHTLKLYIEVTDEICDKCWKKYPGGYDGYTLDPETWTLLNGDWLDDDDFFAHR